MLKQRCVQMILQASALKCSSLILIVGDQYWVYCGKILFLRATLRTLNIMIFRWSVCVTKLNLKSNSSIFVAGTEERRPHWRSQTIRRHIVWKSRIAHASSFTRIFHYHFKRVLSCLKLAILNFTFQSCARTHVERKHVRKGTKILSKLQISAENDVLFLEPAHNTDSKRLNLYHQFLIAALQHKFCFAVLLRDPTLSVYATTFLLFSIS